ncbi:ATP-binding protein [Massilia cavernae]|uniref:ATP-binding protein n=1 Tax=Massilia cavernae TaxID=2320864 RepID=A0A418X7M9_9BURK|nr:ATP-binding protein [Massilia cavernae]RJG08489.1 ATP-binding protein [Massilia cavernae]
MSDDSVSALIRAATEAASNIMIHAYGRRSDRRIELDAEVFADRVVVRFHHLGMSFDPQKVAPPNLDGTQEGGFGMYIIAQSVDEVGYYLDDRGRNCIALIKWTDQLNKRGSHDGRDV